MNKEIEKLNTEYKDEKYDITFPYTPSNIEMAKKINEIISLINNMNRGEPYEISD